MQFAAESDSEDEEGGLDCELWYHKLLLLESHNINIY